MNGGSEDNPDPGFEIWSKNTEQILALVTSTQQAQNLMARGDAWITIWAKGNVQQWADAGAPVGFVVPKEGMLAFPCSSRWWWAARPSSRRSPRRS